MTLSAGHARRGVTVAVLLISSCRPTSSAEREVVELRKENAAVALIADRMKRDSADAPAALASLTPEHQVAVREYVLLLTKPLDVDGVSDICALTRIRYDSLMQSQAITRSGDVHRVHLTTDQIRHLGLRTQGGSDKE